MNIAVYIPLFIYQYSLHILNRKPLVNDIHCEGMCGMGTTSTTWVFPDLVDTDTLFVWQYAPTGCHGRTNQLESLVSTI